MNTILETERLILREFDPSDAISQYLLNLDPEVIRYTGDPPFKSVEEAKELLENYDQYEKYGYGRWSVILKETGKFIGWCGLKFNADGEGDTDLGYRFFKEQWGKGYATEAAQACLDYGFENLELTRIIGRTAKANTASIHVLEKLGMHYWKDQKCHGLDSVYYVIKKS